jgi:murein DD-endopeptidase MepM/ murein hydrolase activator NlpD
MFLILLLKRFAKAKSPAVRWGSRITIGLVAGFWMCEAIVFLNKVILPSAHGSYTPPAQESKAVKITTLREDGVTHFYVENDEFCEVTMTFEMGLVNLQGPTTFPYTVTFPGRQVSEAFALAPIDPASKWEYTFTNYYKLGSTEAHHDDSFVYQLPYAPGRKYKVTQGYNGGFSHKGSNLYAIDWQMPEGTPVYAARGGQVVKVRSDSDKGGSSLKYDQYNNFVLIRHEDGTLGHYCHLQKGACTVEVGQTIQTGDLIAHSGNTGFSSGPHLHFSVYKTKNGRERESIPVKFRTADETAITLISGRGYKASEIAATVSSPRPIASVPDTRQPSGKL